MWLAGKRFSTSSAPLAIAWLGRRRSRRLSVGPRDRIWIERFDPVQCRSWPRRSLYRLTRWVSSRWPLGVSYIAIWTASRPRTPRSHYGLFRAEILASLFNALGLFALTGWIVYESVERLFAPVQVAGPAMVVVATIGLLVNVATAWILGRSGAEDLNTRSALLHMLGDLFSSVVIVIGGLVLIRTGWTWIDPALSLVVALVILWWAVGLLRSSCSILLERAPEGVDPDDVRSAVRAEAGVRDVHDMHIWEITSGYVCVTAHVVVDDVRLSETSALRESICEMLWERFQIAHVTLQIETTAS